MSPAWDTANSEESLCLSQSSPLPNEAHRYGQRSNVWTKQGHQHLLRTRGFSSIEFFPIVGRRTIQSFLMVGRSPADSEGLDELPRRHAMLDYFFVQTTLVTSITFQIQTM